MNLDMKESLQKDNPKDRKKKAGNPSFGDDEDPELPNGGGISEYTQQKGAPETHHPAQKKN